MDFIKISQLDKVENIADGDFFPLVNSGSLTTERSTIETFSNWIELSGSASYSNFSDSATYSLTSSYSPSSSVSSTSSFLIFNSPIVNGTASFGLNSQTSATSSYLAALALSVGFSNYAASASWVTRSISSSYVPGSGIDGLVDSASYVISASYSLSASYVVSSSYVVTASNSLTSSHVKFAKVITATAPFNAYGPFYAHPNTGYSVTFNWGQYDENKRSVSFFLTEASDVIIKCIVNYDIATFDSTEFPLYNGSLRYFGAKLLPEVITSPNTSNTNLELDAIQVIGSRDAGWETGGNHLQGVCEITFKKTSLLAGQYKVYMMPLYTNQLIGPDLSTSASNSQVSTYDAFLNSNIVFSTSCQIEKFSNSAMLFVYSTKEVVAGTYFGITPPDEGEVVDPPVPDVGIWRRWILEYTVTNATITNGAFEYSYTYNSSIGGGTAYWDGPMGTPGQRNTIYLCLPSDHVLDTVIGGPIGTITSGYPHVTSEGCIP